MLNVKDMDKFSRMESHGSGQRLLRMTGAGVGVSAHASGVCAGVRARRRTPARIKGGP
jgi:hypothetical protein